jgi:DNA repair protein RadD
MTLQFEELLGRAAEPTLHQLVGRPAVRLLSRLDPRLAQPDRLREVALGLHSPQEMLFDPEMRAELLNVLPQGQAAELCGRLGIDGSQNPFRALTELRLRRGSSTAQELLGFFGLVDQVTATPPPAPAVEEVNPIHALFAHQRVAAHKVLVELGQGPHRVLLHMPTGAGKTRTAMHVIARMLSGSEPLLVIWLAHSEELCEQAVEEFKASWRALGDRPLTVHRWWGEHEGELAEARDGIVVAGLAKVNASAQRSIEMIGLLAGRAGLVVMDEAHQAVAPTYERALDFLSQAGMQTPLLGLTATPGRTWADIDEDKRLAEFFGQRKVSLEVPGYESPVDYLVSEGYLAQTRFEPLYYQPGFELTERDRLELQTQLEVPRHILRMLAEDEQRNLRIVTRVAQLAQAHSRLIVFAATVEHAYLVATVLRARGLDAEAITGVTPPESRTRMIERFRDDEPHSKMLINFGVLTAGFDAPRTSAAVIARPTQSLVLFSQMVGRATRGPRAGGNTEAEVVTVADTSLPGFASLAESFHNWEDVWNPDN